MDFDFREITLGNSYVGKFKELLDRMNEWKEKLEKYKIETEEIKLQKFREYYKDIIPKSVYCVVNSDAHYLEVRRISKTGYIDDFVLYNYENAFSLEFSDKIYTTVYYANYHNIKRLIELIDFFTYFDKVIINFNKWKDTEESKYFDLLTYNIKQSKEYYCMHCFGETIINLLYDNFIVKNLQYGEKTVNYINANVNGHIKRMKSWIDANAEIPIYVPKLKDYSKFKYYDSKNKKIEYVINYSKTGYIYSPLQ